MSRRIWTLKSCTANLCSYIYVTAYDETTLILVDNCTLTWMCYAVNCMTTEMLS